jgi:hypothetical protein
MRQPSLAAVCNEARGFMQNHAAQRDFFIRRKTIFWLQVLTTIKKGGC